MNAKVRLQGVQSTLSERGVLDVKFLFGHESRFTMPSTLQNDVADVMESFLAGRANKVEDFSEEILPIAA